MGMDDEETSCGEFDKKPFLIRFRNRKYPFCFNATRVGIETGKGSSEEGGDSN